MFVHKCHPDAHALPFYFLFAAFALDSAYYLNIVQKLVRQRIWLHLDIMLREQQGQVFPQGATDLGNDCLVSSRGGINGHNLIFFVLWKSDNLVVYRLKVNSNLTSICRVLQPKLSHDNQLGEPVESDRVQ